MTECIMFSTNQCSHLYNNHRLPEWKSSWRCSIIDHTALFLYCSLKLACIGILGCSRTGHNNSIMIIICNQKEVVYELLLTMLACQCCFDHLANCNDKRRNCDTCANVRVGLDSCNIQEHNNIITNYGNDDILWIWSDLTSQEFALYSYSYSAHTRAYGIIKYRSIFGED